MAQQGDTFFGLPILVALAVILAAVAVAWVLAKGRRKSVARDAGAKSARAAAQPTSSAERYAKRCPTCRSVYADETLAFCLSDGSTMERVPAPARERDPNATLVYADAPRSDLAPTVRANAEEPPAH